MALSSEKLEKWEAANRAPVFPGRLNRWVFIVSKASAESDSELERYARGAVKRLGDRVTDSFRLVRTSGSHIAPAGGVVQRRESLPELPIPFVQPGPVSWVEVEFAWRAPATSVPWVVERYPFGLMVKQDPTAAEVMLDSVGTSGGDVAKPAGVIASTNQFAATIENAPSKIALGAGVGLLAYLLLFRKKR